MMQLVLLGTFFVLPVYLQVVLGLDAFETGKKLFPMSISMLIAALARPEDGGPAIAAARLPGRPRGDGRRGAPADGDDRRDAARRRLRDLARPVRHRRGPAHVAARQRDHVVGAAGGVERGRRSPGDGAEPRRVARHCADRRDPAHVADERASSRGSRRIPTLPQTRADVDHARGGARGSTSSRSTRCEQGAPTPGCRRAQADAVADDYGDAQIDGLKISLLAVAILAALGLWFTRRLPNKPLGAPV